MRTPIYLDSHATTPVDPRVLEAMLPYFTDRFGNPSSRTHRYGWQAADAVARARQQVADLIAARPAEIVFTSGATESNNLAIKGVAAQARGGGNHIITLATEHRSVLDTCGRLEREGFRVSYLPVQGTGLLDLDVLARAIDAGTILISVMTANNEIGVIQPIEEIGRLAKARGVLFHTDAAQAVGSVPMDVSRLQADLVSLTAHKIYGPKGAGALYVRRRNPRVNLVPLLDGGGHERGYRSGTLNVPAIAGLGAAAEICGRELREEAARTLELRDRLLTGLVERARRVCVNGTLDARLTRNLNVSFDGVDGESLMLALDDLAVSAGSACTSGSGEPSHVLRAIGVGDDLARASIRFGLGRFTTAQEIDYAIEKVTDVVRRLRERAATGLPAAMAPTGATESQRSSASDRREIAR